MAARTIWSPSFSRRWTSIQYALDAVEAAQVDERLVQLLALATTIDAWRIAVSVGAAIAVQDERVGDLLDVVDDVVQAADERDDVLAVERRDEGASRRDGRCRG